MSDFVFDIETPKPSEGGFVFDLDEPKPLPFKRASTLRTEPEQPKLEGMGQLSDHGRGAPIPKADLAAMLERMNAPIQPSPREVALEERQKQVDQFASEWEKKLQEGTIGERYGFQVAQKTPANLFGVFDHMYRARLDDAMQRTNFGKPSRRDLEIIGEEQARHKLATEEAQRTGFLATLKRAADVATGLPLMAAEFGLGGMATRALRGGPIAQAVNQGAAVTAGHTGAAMAFGQENPKEIANMAIDNTVLAALGPLVPSEGKTAIIRALKGTAKGVGSIELSKEVRHRFGLTEEGSDIPKALQGDPVARKELLAQLMGFGSFEFAMNGIAQLQRRRAELVREGVKDTDPRMEKELTAFADSLRQIDAENQARLKEGEGIGPGQRPRLPDTVQPAPQTLNIGPQGAEVPPAMPGSTLERPGLMFEDVLRNTEQRLRPSAPVVPQVPTPEAPTTPEAKPGILDRIRARQAGQAPLARPAGDPTLREPRPPTPEPPPVPPMERLRQQYLRGESVDIKEVFDAAGLTPLQKETLLKRLEKTGAGIAEEQGKTRQAVKDVEKRALKRLGASASVESAVVQPEKLARALDLIEQRSLVEPGSTDPVIVSKEFARREAIERKIDEVRDTLEKELANGPLSPERQAYFEREYTRTVQELESGGRTTERRSGALRPDRGGEPEGRSQPNRPTQPPTESAQPSEPQIVVNEAQALKPSGRNKAFEQEAVDLGYPLDWYRAAVEEVKQRHLAEAEAHNEVVRSARGDLGSVANFAHLAEDAASLEGRQSQQTKGGRRVVTQSIDEVAAGLESRGMLDTKGGARHGSDVVFQKIVEGVKKPLSAKEAHDKAMELLAEYQKAADPAPTAEMVGDDLMMDGRVLFSGIPLPPIVRKFFARRQAPAAPAVRVSTERFPPLQDWQEFKKIASEPRGAALVPGVGKIADPRSKADTEAKQAVIAWQAAKSQADNQAHRIRSELKGEFGDKIMADKTAPGDIIEAELAYPGTQNLTPKDREFVRQWKGLLSEAERNARLVGRKWVDADGNPLNPNYFPKTSIEAPGGKTGVGQSFMGRFFKTEAEGIQAGVKYLDPIDRVTEFLKQQGRLDAQHLLSTDAALGGKTPQQWHADEMQKYAAHVATLSPPDQQRFSDKMMEKAYELAKSKDQPGMYSKAFKDRIFPDEVAKELTAYVRDHPYEWMQVGEKIIDASKTLQMGTMDFAAPLIQMQILAFKNPVVWAKATAQGFRRLATGKDGVEELLKDPHWRQVASSFIQAGGSFGERLDYLEGTEKGSLVSKVPIVGKPIGAIAERNGQAVTTLMDYAKLQMWDAYLAKNRPATEMAAMAEFFETKLGLGRSRSIGVKPGMRLLEKIAVIAPSYYRSALNMYGDLMYGSKPVSREAMKTLGAFAVGTAATSVAGMIAAGLSWDEIQRRMNPTNSKFLMFPISLPGGSKIEFGIGGLYRSILSTGIKTLDWAYGGAKVDETTKNPLIQFARSKEGFALRYLTEAWTQEDYQGNPQSITRATIKMGLPITMDQLVNRNDGTAAQQAFGAMAEFFGARNFPVSPKDQYRQRLDGTARSMGKGSYDRLTLREQLQAVQQTEQVAKTPTTATQVSRAIAQQMARTKELESKLDKESFQRLAALGKTVPAYDLNLTIAGKDIPMTKSQVEKFQGYLVEEYNRQIMSWPMDRLKDVPQETKDKYLTSQLRMAKERAKNRLIAQYADAPSK